jgi:hypothetical protein
LDAGIATEGEYPGKREAGISQLWAKRSSMLRQSLGQDDRCPITRCS